jgi:hypothetical protein
MSLLLSQSEVSKNANPSAVSMAGEPHTPLHPLFAMCPFASTSVWNSHCGLPVRRFADAK